MSNVYISEPPCTAKLILETTYGAIEMELWAKECPHTCHAFLKNALEGRFDGASFYRVVPDFCIQTGPKSPALDDNNDDKDGINRQEKDGFIENGSVVSKEIHSRLRFSRRGLVGAVREYAPGTHFFITLAPAPDLTGSLTLFGKVVGDTLFNVLRIGELAVEDDDKPMFDVVITGCTVTQNPFDDLLEIAKKPANKVLVPSKQSSAPVSKSSASGLQFGVVAAPSTGRATPSSVIPTTFGKAANPADSNKKPDALDQLQAEKAAKLAALKASIAQAKAELEGKSICIENQPTEKTADDDAKAKKPLNAVEKMRAAYTSKPKVIVGKRRADDPNSAMDTIMALNAFRSKLANTQSPDDQSIIPDNETTTNSSTTVQLCKLHGLHNCGSCRDAFGLNPILSTNNDNDMEDRDGSSEWMMHRLVFDKTRVDHQIKRDLKELVVLDPQAEMEKLKRRSMLPKM